MRLRIATFNLWGLPWPFSVQKRGRIHQLAELVRREGLDIVACQEVWLNTDLRYLRRLLPGYTVSYHRFRPFNHTGLCFLSRLPLRSVVSIPFDTPLFTPEFPSKKGILRAEVTVGTEVVQLVNTHVYYAVTAEQEARQKQQLDQMIDMLDHEPTLLFGDFNRQYDSLHLPHDFRCISQQQSPSIELRNPYAMWWLNKINASDRLPDNMFANFPVTVRRSYLITEPMISDHYPVVSEVEL